jgi:actin-related protein
MSSLSTFENFAMSQEDYQENGAIYIERKSLC